VVEAEAILAAREVINAIYVDDKVKDYIVDLVCATRNPEHYKIEVRDFIQLGASPRATISLALAAKAHAFLRGRGYVTPQDVKSVAMDVLRHRVAITYEAEAEEKTSETIVQKILDELAGAMIPREILRKIRQIEIRTNRLVTEIPGRPVSQCVQGAGHQLRRGAGVSAGGRRAVDRLECHGADEPSVHQEVCGRAGVDGDAGGGCERLGWFGSTVQSKRELAAEMASVLAFSAIRNQDKVGLLLFTDKVEQFIPPRKGRRHVLRVIREVLFHEPERVGTDLRVALEFLLRVTPHRAVVVVLSDFIGALPATALRQCNRRHDVVAVQITDRFELELPALGRLVLRDAETGKWWR
jgi:hypothetical protein